VPSKAKRAKRLFREVLRRGVVFDEVLSVDDDGNVVSRRGGLWHVSTDLPSDRFLRLLNEPRTDAQDTKIRRKAVALAVRLHRLATTNEDRSADKGSSAAHRVVQDFLEDVENRFERDRLTALSLSADQLWFLADGHFDAYRCLERCVRRGCRRFFFSLRDNTTHCAECRRRAAREKTRARVIRHRSGLCNGHSAPRRDR
jgi:hypothetical protein